MSLKAVIFDLDGVIVFTDKFHYQAWKKMADEMGIYFDEQISVVNTSLSFGWEVYFFAMQVFVTTVCSAYCLRKTYLQNDFSYIITKNITQKEEI